MQVLTAWSFWNISPSLLQPYFQRAPFCPPLVSLTKKRVKIWLVKKLWLHGNRLGSQTFFRGLAEALMGSTSITLVIKIYELCNILPNELSFFLLVSMTHLLCWRRTDGKVWVRKLNFRWSMMMMMKSYRNTRAHKIDEDHEELEGSVPSQWH